MTSSDLLGHVRRLAMLLVLLAVATLAWLPGAANASSGDDQPLHVSHAMHHSPVAADGGHMHAAGGADCAGSAFFCWMMGMCHPALSPSMLVMPVMANVNDPAAPSVTDRSGRHPAIIIPPPRRLFV